MSGCCGTQENQTWSLLSKSLAPLRDQWFRELRRSPRLDVKVEQGLEKLSTRLSTSGWTCSQFQAFTVEQWCLGLSSVAFFKLFFSFFPAGKV